MADGMSKGVMHTPGAFLGVLADGTVNTVAVMDSTNVMEALKAGEIIVPCTVEQCRALWGKPVMPPIDLGAAIRRATNQQEAA